MILPWLIGQAFVQVGASAMMLLILIGVILNLMILFVFMRVSANPGAVVQPSATTD